MDELKTDYIYIDQELYSMVCCINKLEKMRKSKKKILQKHLDVKDKENAF